MKLKHQVTIIFFSFTINVVWSYFYTPGTNIQNCEKKDIIVSPVTDPAVLKKENLITSENFGEGNYSSNMNCGWEITANNGSGKILLNLLFFDVEFSKRCFKFDYLRIYEKGFGDEWTLTQDYMCGRQLPRMFVIWGTKAYIEFKTDQTENRLGFNMTYNIQYVTGAPVIRRLGREEDNWERKFVIYEQKSVTMKCEVSANPKASIEWFFVNKDGILTEIDKNRKIGTPPEHLTLNNVKLEQAGHYGCSARNKYVESSETIQEFLQMTVYEKCICPKEIKIIWYEYPPYTQYVQEFDIEDQPMYKGIFYQIVDTMLKSVCGVCQLGHGPSTLIWDGANNRKNTLDDVKAKISRGEFDVALPIMNYEEFNTYRNNIFLKILNVPGFQYLKKPTTDGGDKIFTALYGILPIVGLTICMIMLAGIVFWMLDTYWNEEELPRTVIQGILHGAWWAYITMTTVGYGDKAPRGIPGRLFGVFWIMAGLVIISILTGAISTALTIASMKITILVQSRNLGAIKSTEEFRYGVSHAAKMTGFDTFTEIVEEINTNKENKKDQLIGVLVDTYVAGYHEELHQLDKNNIIALDGMVYGVVFGKNISDPDTQVLFQKYLDKKDFMIDLIVAENIRAIPDIPSFELMDPKSDMFVTAVLSLLGMLLIFSLAGLGFEYGYMKPKQRQIMEAKNLEMIESKSVKKLARSEQIMKKRLIEEMEMFEDQWKQRIDHINEKHENQKKQFAADQEEILAEQKRQEQVEMEQMRQQANSSGQSSA